MPPPPTPKHIEQRACWCPEHYASYEDVTDNDRYNLMDRYFFQGISADVIRKEAEALGQEVIDLHKLKCLLYWVAEEYQQRERLHEGTHCPKCGMKSLHVYKDCVEPVAGS